MEIRFHIHVPYTMLREKINIIEQFELAPEVFLSGDMLDDFSLAHFRETAAMIADAGLETSIHGPFTDLAPGSPDRTIRHASENRIRQAIDIASLFSAKTMVCHPGYDDWRVGEYVDKWLDISVHTWKKISAHAKDSGVVLALENIFEKRPDTLLTILKRVDSPFFKACFDVGHFNLFSEIGLHEWIEKIAPFLAELHLHDNLGVADNHWPPGRGNFPFADLLSALRNADADPVFALEIHKEGEVANAVAAMTQLLQESYL